MQKIPQEDRTLRALCELRKQSIVQKGKVTYMPFYMAKTKLLCGIAPEQIAFDPSHSFFRQEDDGFYFLLAIKGLKTRTFFAYLLSESEPEPCQPKFFSWLSDDMGSCADDVAVWGELFWSYSDAQLQAATEQAEAFFSAFKVRFTEEIHNQTLKEAVKDYDKDQWAEVLYCNEEHVGEFLETWVDGADVSCAEAISLDMELHDIILYDGSLE